VCLTHGLDAGNCVVLRVPSGSHESAFLLASALSRAGTMNPFVHLIEAPAKAVLDAFYASRSPGLVHYFGGSGRIPDLLAVAFRAGKGCIADGEGNTWVFVAEGCDPAVAAEVLSIGSTRYWGQTCTSINGAIIHPSLWEEVARLVRNRFLKMEPGSPGDADSARACLETLTSSGGAVLVGGDVSGALLSPTLIGAPPRSSALVREGVFGPGLWIDIGDEAYFRRLWLENRYPLCACVLGPDVDVASWSALPNLARLVVNGDPSLEDPLESWGGYPPSGNSRVSGWTEKYRRTVQVDQPR
jgi:acyl-CoA reductase-like NAD-dependent aldehyde dehydrogenase